MNDDKSGRRKLIPLIAISASVAVILTGLLVIRPKWLHRSFPETIYITGAVLRQHKNPAKQGPIANVEITAVNGSLEAQAKSDSSGFFRLALRPGLLSDDRVTLKAKHEDYKPFELVISKHDQLHVLRLEPIVPDRRSEHDPAAAEKALPIKNVRVRYTMKSQVTADVGSLAKQFEIANTGSIPCDSQRLCSPDGKWKAAIGSFSLDAEGENQFRNVRVTCIAGPCPFATIRSGDLSRPSRFINLSVLNWSDTVTILVEAEVTRTAITDSIRQSYPAIVDQTMTFALPGAAEGTTIEADVNGEEIAFPIGPKLILSWATCFVDVAPDQNRTYRCELKPGYQFPP